MAQVLLKKGSPVPNSVILTLFPRAGLNVTLSYAPDADVPPTERHIGRYAVGPLSPPPGAEKAKLKVKFRVNLNSLLSVESCQVSTPRQWAVDG